MKTIITLFFCGLLAGFSAEAQSPYMLSASSQTYVPLTGASSANGSAIWSTQFFTMPLGFSGKLGMTSVSKLFTDGTDIYADTSGGSVDLFQLFFASSVDRGLGGSASKTPLRYQTTGSAPNRIFKFEGVGIGFAVEKQMYGTFADSFDYQFWLYEGSNIAELRFGPSKISHAADYFQGGQPSFTGYFNVSFDSGSGNIGYFAAGPVGSPYLDSFTDSHMPGLLSAYPPSGTVYRFTPKTTTSVAAIRPELHVSLFPTITTGALTINYQEALPATFHIFSATGALLQEGSLRNGINTMDFSRFAPGSYLAMVRAGGKRGICRFQKQ